MTETRLDPMTEAEFAAFLPDAISRYATAQVQTGGVAADGALEWSAAQHAELLPQGVSTPKNHLYVVRDGDQQVGTLWLNERTHGGAPLAYVVDIHIEESQRGKGYGEGAMRALESEVRALGLDKVQLHVFGDNTVARSLYGKIGFVETNVVMVKQID